MTQIITREDHAKARVGMLTGSRIQRIMTGGPRVWNSVAKEMRNPPRFWSLEDAPNMPPPLAWGQTHEPQAAAMFWDRHPEYEVRDPKFLRYHDKTPELFARHLGYSPDRVLVRKGRLVGLLETKCPYDGEIHVATIQAGILPEWCRWQVYGGLLVSGFGEAWFVCWDPRAQDPDWRYFELRIVPDPALLERTRTTCLRFLEGFTAGVTFQHEGRLAARYEQMF